MSRRPDLKEEARKAWRLATAPLRAMPSFVIAGAPKCGTSSLYDWITSHPDARRGLRKEPTNFTKYPGSRFRAAANYPFALGRFVCGDGSVEYFAHPDGPARVREVIPDARLFFLFRDPVERAWSDYQMFRKAGTDPEDFSRTVRRAVEWLSDRSLDPLVDAACREPSGPLRYVVNGLYARLAERWLEVFPRGQCLFLASEELFADPAAHAGAVFRHVGLDPAGAPAFPVARDGGYRERIDAASEELLRGFYAGENARLAEVLGMERPW